MKKTSLILLTSLSMLYADSTNISLSANTKSDQVSKAAVTEVPSAIRQQPNRSPQKLNPASHKPTTSTAVSGTSAVQSHIPKGLEKSALQPPDIVFENPHIGVLANCSYQWSCHVRNNSSNTITGLVIVVQGKRAGKWEDLRTSGTFSLAPGQLYPLAIGFDRTGLTRSRVIVKQGQTFKASSAVTKMPVHDVQITGVVLTDIKGILRLDATIQNKGSIPVCTGHFIASKKVGTGWSLAGDSYLLTSPLSAGQTRLITRNLDVQNADEVKLEFFAKYVQADNAWHMLDRAPLPINENTVLNFIDNISMNVAINQTPPYHIASVMLVNNNKIPADNLKVRGYSTNPSFSGWAGETSVYNPPVGTLAAGQTITRDMNWGRDYRSNSFKTVLEYQGEVIKEQILPLNTPVTVTIEYIQATRSSPQFVNWSARIANPSTAGIGGMFVTVKRKHGSGSWIMVQEDTVVTGIAAGSSRTMSGQFNASIPGKLKVTVEAYTFENPHFSQKHKIAEGSVNFE